ncbi:hypothetical protein N0V83_003086 [Neocucurbitaria cava]|uniref:Uncharacterized protein n=1 Tax=Neocucurbitaria cava TaxID=798079 RepID=A0A9W8YCT0_9PLEO|nr:hypothetical protein N0V83_003086 [Neocucurbitaria cava]
MSADTNIASTSVFLPNPDLQPLPVSDCIPEKPPSLAVWLLSRPKRVSVTTLATSKKRCAICNRLMCNYRYLLRKRLKIMREAAATAKKAPLSRFPWSQFSSESDAPPLADRSHPIPIAAKRPTLVISPRSADSMQTSRQPPAFVEPPHTCDRIKCETPIKIRSPDCGHYIGNACLEDMIIYGRTQCPVCRTIWFKEAKSRPQIVRENFFWRTPACFSDVGEVQVSGSYQGATNRVVVAVAPWQVAEDIEDETEEDTEDESEEDHSGDSEVYK